ncbi:hypothetical protein Tco_0577886 [Tanacetum coccineum]
MSVHNSIHNTPHNSDDEDEPDLAVTLISKLDLSHPFHLHPTDSTTLTVVFVKLKGTENYQVWSCAMLLALEETLPDVRSAYAIISNEESHRVASGNIVKTSHKSQTSAFIANVPNRGSYHGSQISNNVPRPSNIRPNDNGNIRTVGGSNLVYENCGFNCHTIDKCFKIIGYRADFHKKKAGQNFKRKNVSNNVVGSISSSGFSDEQLSTLISLIKENSINEKSVQANMAVWESATQRPTPFAVRSSMKLGQRSDLVKSKPTFSFSTKAFPPRLLKTWQSSNHLKNSSIPIEA